MLLFPEPQQEPSQSAHKAPDVRLDQGPAGHRDEGSGLRHIIMIR